MNETPPPDAPPERAWVRPVLFLAGLAVVTIAALWLLDMALPPKPADFPAPAKEPEFRGPEATSEAANVRIIAVEQSGSTMLTVNFEGPWSLSPAVHSSAPAAGSPPLRNGVIFLAKNPAEEAALADLGRRFRAVQTKSVSFTITHRGWVSYGGVPLISMAGATVVIKE